MAKVVILGSSCIYPREAPQPMPEDALLTGPLEETNEGYAIAKIAALELGKMYRRQYGMDCISLMPTNLYGPNDNFDLRDLARAAGAAAQDPRGQGRRGADTVEMWGTGTPRREFLHADDLADATIFATRHYSGEQHLNVGRRRGHRHRASSPELIADVVGWDGELVFNTDMPDGAPRKLLDVSRLTELGWTPSIGLREGIGATYEWFQANLPEGACERGWGQLHAPRRRRGSAASPPSSDRRRWDYRVGGYTLGGVARAM